MTNKIYKYIFLLFLQFTTLTIYAYEPMIREDRIWEYVTHIIPPDVGPGPSTEPEDIFKPIMYKFEGTEKHNGYTYHKLLRWYPKAEDPTPEVVALMREENSRVYLLLNKAELYLECPYILNPKDGDRDYLEPLKVEVNKNEVLLYDFSKAREWGVGSDTRLQLSYDNSSEFITNLHTQYFYENAEKWTLVHAPYKDFTLSQNNVDWKLRIFSLNKELLANITIPQYFYEVIDNMYTEWLIEGIGNVGRGLMNCPWMGDRALILSQFVSTVYVYFVRQTDLDGNIIFNAPWVEGSGVEEVAAPVQETDEASYDLSGKRVVNPEPGTIYIQDGKKHIAH